MPFALPVKRSMLSPVLEPFPHEAVVNCETPFFIDFL